jgi:hypothetical protein
MLPAPSTRNRDASSDPNRPEGCLRSSWRIQDPILHHHPTQTSTSIPPHVRIGRHITRRYHHAAAATTWMTRKWKSKSKSTNRIRIHPPLVAPLCVHKDDSLLLLPESSRDGCKCVSYATIHTSTHPPLVFFVATPSQRIHIDHSTNRIPSPIPQSHTVGHNALSNIQPLPPTVCHIPV